MGGVLIALAVLIPVTQGHAQECDPPGSVFFGGVFLRYEVTPCDAWRCLHQPIGRRQAVLSIYSFAGGEYAMCACTACGVTPNRAPADEPFCASSLEYHPIQLFVD
jgi:hypothetical protein